MKKNLVLAKIFCTVVLYAAVFINTVQADIIGYDFYIFNDSSWQSDSRLTFNLTISDEGSNQVGFCFTNTSLLYSSIAEIYFDADTNCLSSMSSEFLEAAGVDFDCGKKNANLPGGENLNPAFAKKADFSAVKSGSASNGINPDEWLKIFFTVEDGTTTETLSGCIVSGRLRIGLHITSIGGNDGPSVSAINNILPAPEPATIVILAVAGFAIMPKRQR